MEANVKTLGLAEANIVCDNVKALAKQTKTTTKAAWEAIGYPSPTSAMVDLRTGRNGAKLTEPMVSELALYFSVKRDYMLANHKRPAASYSKARQKDFPANVGGSAFYRNLMRAAQKAGKSYADLQGCFGLAECYRWSRGAIPKDADISALAKFLGTTSDKLTKGANDGTTANVTTPVGTFLAKLEDIAKEQGLSVNRLVVTRAGISRATLHCWRTGKGTPSWRTIQNLGRILGVNPETLMAKSDCWGTKIRRSANVSQFVEQEAPSKRIVDDPLAVSPDIKVESGATLATIRGLAKAYAPNMDAAGFAAAFGLSTDELEALMTHQRLLFRADDFEGNVRSVFAKADTKSLASNLRKLSAALS